MTRLSPEAYLAHVREESARFRAVLADSDPAARVPSCPDWNAADLLWHLATVQRWWADVLSARPMRPAAVDPPRPEAYDDLLAAFDEWSAELATALESAEPTQEAWTWSSDHTVGFILRRQAHEALIHRIDAEQAARVTSPVDPALAADGVHEVLDVMYGGCPPWGSWSPLPHLIRVDATDTGDQTWLQLGLFSGTDPRSGESHADDEDFHVVADPGGDVEPDAVIDGPASALDLWLWDRGTDEEISVAGDRDLYDRFRVFVSTPLR